MRIDPTAAPLSETEAKLASAHLQHEQLFPRLARTLTDPTISDQKIALYSFLPHKDAIPAPNGRFGYLKIRGVWPTKADAQFAAHNLIKNHDSYNEIYHVLNGHFIPLGLTPVVDVDQLDEVQLDKDMTENISQKIEQKRKEDAGKIAEIEAQAKKLKEEEVNPTTDPLDRYIELRVKYATLKFTYQEHEKKVEEIKGLLRKTKAQIGDADEQNPEFRDKFFDKYMAAFVRSGLDKQKPDAMAEAFMKYLCEDIELPFLEESTSHGQYAILVELDWRTMENFFTFIVYEGNELVLQKLNSLIAEIDEERVPHQCSIFYMDIRHLVTEKTAREMAACQISFEHQPLVIDSQLEMTINDDCKNMGLQLFTLLGRSSPANIFDQKAARKD